LDLPSAAFEYASALGTVGLSVGFTRPEMPLASKVAEILGMWVGRLEFVAICHAFMKVVRDVRRR
ncbi:MAG TPA: TrkH family potassium uptake protein, partial [Alphaproteobacteria bacterium]|nr:TrkH family potassium uptake protein [Alphaproteobacteria bacterium]